MTQAQRRSAILAPLAAVLLVVGVVAGSTSLSKALGRHDARSRIDQKVEALLSRMTLAEKFGQLTMAGPDGANGAPGPLLTAGAKNGTIGSVLNLVGVDNINEAQKAALSSRLHIPLIFSLDVIHGYRTIFPLGIGEASTWDPATVSGDESVSAREATADGIKWTFNPMVDIARDPRWGRVVEGAGEDPYLGSAIAAAKVRGYQGSDYSRPEKMASTVKHFAAYGAPVAGREYNTTDMSTQQLFNDYLPPYQAAIGAGAATVMSSFNSLNGVPVSGSTYALQHILRSTFDFTGSVVSDYQAVQELVEFGYAANEQDAARLALTAGVDIEMAVQVPSINSTYDNYGPALVKSGKISVATVDRLVRHVLRLKYLAGMFDHPYTDPSRVATAELTPQNLAQARRTADESMVLLRNENALPLSTTTGKIAVVGPLADNAPDQLGSNVPIGQNAIAEANTVTVLKGIKNAVPNASVTYAQGCDAVCDSDAGFGDAVAAANAADTTVVVLGEPASYSGEASSRSNIDLPGKQLALVQAIAATHKPYVVVLLNGRPLTIPWLADNAPGLVEAWQPGTEGGNAVADVLFGSFNPGGKLPMTFPRNVGQIPISYNELPTGRPYDANNKYTSRYLDVPNSPQYSFGYGLSYTTFSLTNLRLSSSSIGRDGTATVSVDVTNTGSKAGSDVAQIYIHDRVASILQPVRKLVGFRRVTLDPGRTTTLRFSVGRSALGYYDNNAHFAVEPGDFDVWAGDSSVGGQHATLTVR
ncbi:MAG TPA: glycoside hydrolase family 3 N-terminal domain-containing protein [Jatrophihabitans sp.]|jgi:beta-glucosidase|uniref:glycoside hydrolase family 3 N-terminal domain-containing protein n=1 Tax=Jatrophihabitans sp. TaxID=1932789 RepID=UPI002E091724|nr:glycoside hydrolase family 3 N-terminal domain-containing protein [Jatrophihabitans sp.]